MPFKISTYKYCKSVKIICIILYYLWNFENKYSVCLSVCDIAHLDYHDNTNLQTNHTYPVHNVDLNYVARFIDIKDEQLLRNMRRAINDILHVNWHPPVFESLVNYDW